MRVVVDYRDESLEFEVGEERVVAAWRGPEAAQPADAAAALSEALQHPLDYPPLGDMIVPGDRVTLAVDPSIPDPGSVLGVIRGVLEAHDVDSEQLTILSPPQADPGASRFPVAAGRHVFHDADEREQLAYLASTKEGRRVYLNRLLTDADVVVPVGCVRYDADLGYRGPWSVLFPGLSERGTMAAIRSRLLRGDGTVDGRTLLDEALEVSWLLGTQFHIGILPAARGTLEIVAGRDGAVRDRCIAALERHWTLRAPARSDLVVAGVGRPGMTATLEDLAAALETARRLVRHGGKIVVLSRAGGTIGPAVQRLMAVDDPREAAAALRGHEADDDHATALRIARAASWADVFLLSGLDANAVEDLSIMPLERPEQARRLVAGEGSVTFVNRAELTHADILPD